MGFHVELNSILRSDVDQPLNRGVELPFEKSGSRLFFDDIPIWLTRSDWTALAEIRVLSQTRTVVGVQGRFRVLHRYEADEQAALTRVFRRMYAGGGDPYIYLLLSAEDFSRASASGVWDPPSRRTEGFIHASPADQLTRVANKHYSQHSEVKVLALRADRLQSEVRWEPATGGLYPHVYGPISLDAMERMETVPRATDGRFTIRMASPSR